ncbi:MAG: 3'(2'),5'-bisphosphate nucleotidase CysQ [Alphaproteobacteria bacterium]|nr:3'(2'),5'-bisphosphate nucleotidase CysQ [Alphaproteobacteria bacterium]
MLYEPDYPYLVKETGLLAIQAGIKALEFYDNGFAVESKPDDTPVTEADKALEKLIRAGLKDITPDIPIIGEEGDKNGDISNGVFWLLDPIDGTKEFIKHNGEFTVNIGLIVNRKPVFGMVYAPVFSEYYYNKAKDIAVYTEKIGTDEQELHTRKLPDNPEERTIFISRSNHQEKEYLNLLNGLSFGKKIPLGSSLKICRIAAGKADMYPLGASTYEWDTAAAHSVLTAAGGHIYDFTEKQELSYAKKDFRNPLLLITGFAAFS